MPAESVGQIGLDLVVNANQFRQQMSGITNTASRQMSGLTSLAKKAGAAIAGAFAVKQLVDFWKSCIELGSDLAEVQNVVDVTFPAMSAQVDKFAKSAAESFGLSETMAKKFTGTFGAMAKAFGFSESAAYDMSTTLTGLAGDVASFYNLTQEEAYTKLKSVFTGETESLKDLGVVMTQSALDAYAMANGFGKTTSAMTEQEKVALRYSFVQNQLSAAQGDFARTSDGWANQVRILKLQFESLKATIGQGLINVLTPVIKTINALIGRLTTAANAFKAFTELLTGKKSTSGSGVSESLSEGISDTASAADGLADSADGVGSAAKNAAKQLQGLMGFDKINKLSEITDTGSSGSSSGSGGTGSYGGSSVDYGEAAKGETIVDEMLGKIDNLGAYISDSLATAMEKIDWKSIYAKARSFGTDLADFLNNLITPRLFYDLGKTIAGAINTALNAVNAFEIEFDWANLGRSLGERSNGLAQNIDWNMIADSLVRGINGAFVTLYNYAVTFDWVDLGIQIRDSLYAFLTGVDWIGAANSLNAVIEGISDALTTICTKENFEAFFDGFIQLFSEIKWEEVLKTAAGLIINGLSGALAAVAKNPLGSLRLIAALATLFSIETIGKGALLSAVKGLGNWIISKLVGTLTGAASKKAVGDAIGETISGATTAGGAAGKAGLGSVLGTAAKGLAAPAAFAASVAAIVIGTKKLQEFEDAAKGGNGRLTELGGAVDMVSAKFGGDFAQSLFLAKEELENNNATSDEYIETLSDMFIQAGISADAISGAYAAATDGMIQSVEQQEMMEGVIKRVGETIQTTSVTSEESYNMLTDALREMAKESLIDGDLVNSLALQLESVKFATPEEQIRLLTAWMSDMGIDTDTATQRLRELCPELFNTGTAGSEASGSVSKLSDELDGLSRKNVKNKLSDMADGMKGIGDKAKGAGDNTGNVKSKMKDLTDGISLFGVLKLGVLKGALSDIGTVDSTSSILSLQSSSDDLNMSHIRTEIDETVSTVQTGLSNVQGGFSNLTSTIQQNSVNSAVSNMASGMRGNFNTIIGYMNNLISGAQSTWNQMASLLSFNIKIPAALAKVIGYSSMSMSLPYKSAYSVPYLAQGAYVKANTPQLAMIGDNRHQGEFVAPEDKLREMAAEAARSAGSGGVTRAELETIMNRSVMRMVTAMSEMGFYLDGEQVSKATRTAQQAAAVRFNTVEVI